ncbi:MAG: prepilin-type N-terminal cleavage/methylation domain-containing protein [Nitrospirae bacterium]|nr:prepilin-type N-terminal cleavage/methylation domain-containing protein [Nitrospirota bacterium]
MRIKAFSVQRSAFSEKQNLFTYSPIHLFTNKKGATLVELIVTLTIFSIIVTMMYSSYSTFLKQVTAERKTAKTELDIFTVSWPLMKDIETAGFGVPKTGTCTPALSESGGALIIHSTAAGKNTFDDTNAGAWSYVYNISTTCGSVYTVSDTVKSGIPSGNIVVINNLDKTRMGLTSVGGATGTANYNFVTACTTDYINNVAYWTPYIGGTDLECYETKYKLTDLTSTSPKMCTTGTKILSRSASKTTTEDYDPILDCVLTLAYRFGCIDSSGNLTWKTNATSCGTAKLRLMKIGMVIQSSTKGASSPVRMDLFEDIGSSFVVATTLTTEQRNYRWRKLEQTITLKNQE